MAANAKAKFSPHVVRQLFILALCRFAEPVALTSVFPYLYYMIASFNVPKEKISFYAGLTAGCFSFAQFFTGILWGRASDKYGRKPTILLGLTGTLVCLLLFGFSTSLPMALCARSLSGLVNGNVGILRTTVAEMVPEKSLQPRAFSIMPLIWSVGSIIGPMIGGALADPLRNHPEWFNGSRPAFFEKFPFALPNMAAALFFLVGVPIGILFLQETLATKKNRRDPGLELGNKILRKLGIDTSSTEHHKDVSADEETTALPKVDEKPPPLKDALTVQSSLNILLYTLLAFHSVTFDQLLPVLMAYPPEDPATRTLPFKFAGGFGMSSSEVGLYFSVYGIIGMILQVAAFPPITNRFGCLNCLKASIFTYPLIYALIPFLLILPEPLQRPCLFIAMAIKCICGIFSFPCSTILLTNASPSLRVLGTLNGIAVASAALGRASGPAFFGYVFTHGQSIGYVMLPWLLLAVVTLFSGLPTMFMVEGRGFADDGKVTEEEERLLTKNDDDDDTTNDYGTVVRHDDNQRRAA